MENLTRRQIAKSSGDNGGDMSFLWADELCEPKVGDMSLHLLIEQNVAGFDVAMNNVGDAIVMQVAYTSSTP